jgi:hypothetical protein
MSVDTIDEIFEGDFHRELLGRLRAFGHEKIITKFCKKFESRTRGDNRRREIFIGIRKGSEDIEVSQKEWILVVNVSKRILNIVDMLVCREIIIKKLPSSSDNRIFSLKHFDPKLRFLHRC